jgi:hypothetical protein
MDTGLFKKSPEAETTNDNDEGKAIGGPEDVPMEDEAEKMQRAARQSAYQCLLLLLKI